MYNEYVTNEFTIRDLLTHRSGLGLGAGDLMIWPDGHNFTPEDIIRNIQYLKPDFRLSKQNTITTTFCMSLPAKSFMRVTGKPWAEFIEERIMKPLQMNQSAASWKTAERHDEFTIVPHVPTDGKLLIIPRYTNQIFDAAAGIYTNVNDLSKWVIMQLDNGKYGDGKRLVQRGTSTPKCGRHKLFFH
jgi:CubicO group peptidase (beta-lactamase class C family)